MLEAIKPLLDGGLITEEIGQELNEAWESKLNEAREQVRAELREEFAQRYEHDKTNMVEALDRMVTESLSVEIQSVAAEKQQLAEDRVKFQTKMRENATKFNDFMVTKLAEEIGELRKDRKTHNEGLEKLEKFIVKALAEEIAEFAQDKQDLVETKVRLIREARNKLESLKTRFVKESASKMSKSVARHLKQELSQLHEDIRVARENNFGRKIFEAYAAEFGATHLNSNVEVKKLSQQIAEKDRQLKEATKIVRQAKVLVEAKNKEIKLIKESNERVSIMEDLLAPLNREKQEIMSNLLESVQTSRLKSAFEKYLPAVLSESSPKTKKVINENVRVVTGDKTNPEESKPEENRSNVIDLKRLAGL